MKACVLHIHPSLLTPLFLQSAHKPTFLGLLLPLKNGERLDHSITPVRTLLRARSIPRLPPW